MSRIIMTLLGLILLGLGIWATISWWPAVRVVLLAFIALGLLLLGLVLAIFGFSEIMGAMPAKPRIESTPPEKE